MPKFIIADDVGNIIRAINLPYEGNLIDVSSMTDEAWEIFYQNIHAFQAVKDDSGQWHIKEHTTELS